MSTSSLQTDCGRQLLNLRQSQASRCLVAAERFTQMAMKLYNAPAEWLPMSSHQEAAREEAATRNVTPGCDPTQRHESDRCSARSCPRHSLYSISPAVVSSRGPREQHERWTLSSPLISDSQAADLDLLNHALGGLHGPLMLVALDPATWWIEFAGQSFPSSERSHRRPGSRTAAAEASTALPGGTVAP